MIKKTILFSRPARLSTQLNQLKIEFKDQIEQRSIPIEDIGMVIMEHPQLSYTQSVLSSLAENNCAVVFIGRNFYPSGILLPFDNHQTETEHFRYQIEASEPLKKQLWQQTVVAKIKNQAHMLEFNGLDGTALKQKAKKVLSGDSSFEEAKAAKRYWLELFRNESFKRERWGDNPNHALNYGYAILRAAVARAIAGSGLLPALGIFHRNKYNSFCLADDIMEPYRPVVDHIVYTHHQKVGWSEELNTQEKAILLKLLVTDVQFSNQTSPLSIGLSRTTASLVRCFKGTGKKLIYPSLCDSMRTE